MQELLEENEENKLIIELERDPVEKILLIRRVFLENGDKETELEKEAVLTKEKDAE